MQHGAELAIQADLAPNVDDQAVGLQDVQHGPEIVHFTGLYKICHVSPIFDGW
jgi:hypothetical protein